MPPPNPDDPYCDGYFQRKPGSQYSMYPATTPANAFPSHISLISCTRCSQPVSYDTQLESHNWNSIHNGKFLYKPFSISFEKHLPDSLPSIPNHGRVL